jgi:cytochrome c oxidase subunit 2
MGLYVQQYAEILYLSLICVYLAFFATIYRMTSRGTKKEEAESHAKGMERKEKMWLSALIIIAVVGNGIMLSPLIPSAALGLYPNTPVMTVRINVADYKFQLPSNPIVIPVNEPVEFVVTSSDVTYGFGVFRTDGTMVCQMQVVPGYQNRLVWSFDTAGSYTIRSTEYAGPETPKMVLHDAIRVSG